MTIPPRRWFQFKLSTWFVLVGITAWVMMLKPFFSSESLTAGQLTGRNGLYVNIGMESWENAPYLLFRIGPAPELAGPVIALLAFVGWKAAWAIRRGERGEADDSLREAAHVPSRY